MNRAAQASWGSARGNIAAAVTASTQAPVTAAKSPIRRGTGRAVEAAGAGTKSPALMRRLLGHPNTSCQGYLTNRTGLCRRLTLPHFGCMKQTSAQLAEWFVPTRSGTYTRRSLGRPGSFHVVEAKLK
jgi:hypothetical protein